MSTTAVMKLVRLTVPSEDVGNAYAVTAHGTLVAARKKNHQRGKSTKANTPKQKREKNYRVIPKAPQFLTSKTIEKEIAQLSFDFLTVPETLDRLQPKPFTATAFRPPVEETVPFKKISIGQKLRNSVGIVWQSLPRDLRTMVTLTVGSISLAAFSMTTDLLNIDRVPSEAKAFANIKANYRHQEDLAAAQRAAAIPLVQVEHVAFQPFADARIEAEQQAAYVRHRHHRRLTRNFRAEKPLLTAKEKIRMTLPQISNETLPAIDSTLTASPSPMPANVTATTAQAIRIDFVENSTSITPDQAKAAITYQHRF